MPKINKNQSHRHRGGRYRRRLELLAGCHGPGRRSHRRRTQPEGRGGFPACGDSEVELVKPTAGDTGVAKFLAEHGGGMHHLCFEVDDIDAMLAQLKAKGVRLINETATQLPGRKMAFIHPKSTGGVLVELYQITPQDALPE